LAVVSLIIDLNEVRNALVYNSSRAHTHTHKYAAVERHKGGAY